MGKLRLAVLERRVTEADAEGESRLLSQIRITRAVLAAYLVVEYGLLPDMPSLLTRLHPKDSAYIALITGPSRTADIERVLTIGVHGPERLVIVFVDDLGGAN